MKGCCPFLTRRKIRFVAPLLRQFISSAFGEAYPSHAVRKNPKENRAVMGFLLDVLFMSCPGEEERPNYQRAGDVIRYQD
ncbi:hypothetical protein CEXT_792871 [Caerostris extrusa]|uniref:Uncharacterized protein n=1 Tax=Caerostris extrusa TaxID=172846 RepID=A0AAV4MN05_CAEEX|nr:hypothetical protein CEXT_792871 [Caerostris extrusa]